MIRTILATLFAAALLHAAPAEAKTTPELVVVGDSISARAFYVERGGVARQHWVERLARRTHTKVRYLAQRGSGYIVPSKCTGTTALQRINSYGTKLDAAAAVVVAIGVNDWHACDFHDDGTHSTHKTTDDELAAAVEQTCGRVDELVTDNSKVVITVPYGPLERLRPYRDRIVALTTACAASHGFQYVDTAHGTLTAKNTRDGIHPNAAGAYALYRTVFLKSDYRRRFP